jgi:RluA family pseudouridine synthase
VNKIEIPVIYEDEFLLAVNKPAGLVSVPAPHIPEYRTLQGQLREQAIREGKDYKPYLLNRLDQDTSGVLLLGKHPRDREALESIFEDSRTQKTYLAWVKWVPKQAEGTISFPLEARSIKKKVPAVTHYKILKKIANSSLLEVRIETGRKHQIRKHLAMIGHPLILDREYGDKTFNNLIQRQKKGKGKFYLHSWKTRFHHPRLNIEVEIEAPAPVLS